jgi:hypothetical protein
MILLAFDGDWLGALSTGVVFLSGVAILLGCSVRGITWSGPETWDELRERRAAPHGRKREG